jgi:hypothetical protein
MRTRASLADRSFGSETSTIRKVLSWITVGSEMNRFQLGYCPRSKNLGLREDHLLAGSGLHREGFQDQSQNSKNVRVRFELASSRRHRLPK